MDHASVPGYFEITDRLIEPAAGPGDCWVVRTWRPDGYAEYGRAGRRQEVLVHRIAWVAHHKRSIPAGHEVHHECHQRACVNPRHLKLLTKAAHQAIHRPPTPAHPPEGLCRHGHEWACNAVMTTQGRWICIECRREAGRRHDARRRAA